MMKIKIEHFIKWWVEGLVLLIPRSIQDWVFLRPDRLVITKEDGSLKFKLISGENSSLLDTRKIDINNELEVKEGREWLAGLNNTPTEIAIEISLTEVLTKSIVLPAASESEIHSVLGFEMDRQTPFRLEQVLYDCKISERDIENEKITVILYVTPKQGMDNLIEKLKLFNLKPELALVRDNENVIQDINLLRGTRSSNVNKTLDPLTKGFMACAAIMVLIALYLPITFINGRIDKLEEEVNRYREEALSIQTLVKERNEILARTQFLDKRLGENKQMIAIIDELTSILPDNTWLSRLILREGEIQIHGESDTAIAIIQLIEDSYLFKDAQFRSPVTQNNVTRKDRFHVSAVIENGSAS